MTRRRLLQRVAMVVVGGAGLVAVTALVGLEPRPAAVVLLVALAVVGLGLVADRLEDPAVTWFPVPISPPLAHGRDPATMAYARRIENHLSVETPGADLRDRLAVLADEVLRDRHGVVLASPEGARLLGPDVTALLTGPVRRFSLPTIDQCLRTIEEL